MFCELCLWSLRGTCPPVGFERKSTHPSNLRVNPACGYQWTHPSKTCLPPSENACFQLFLCEPCLWYKRKWTSFPERVFPCVAGTPAYPCGSRLHTFLERKVGLGLRRAYGSRKILRIAVPAPFPLRKCTFQTFCGLCLWDLSRSMPTCGTERKSNPPQ